MCKAHKQIYSQKKGKQHLGKEHGCSADKNQSNVFMLSIHITRLDYQPLFGKGAALFSGRVDQTRESGGNRA